MTIETWDFETLSSAAMAALRLKTEAHQTWGLGRFQRWDLDQADGRLTFSDPRLGTAVAPAQIVGSLDTDAGTWLWAWGNPSIDAQLRGHSEAVREFGTRRGFERLTEPEWRAGEDDAWAMAAVATMINSAQGAYRGPVPGGLVFITFGEVALYPPGRRPLTSRRLTRR